MTLIQLREYDLIYLEEACGKEIAQMADLLKDSRYLVLETSLRGVRMQARGCSGLISFGDGTMVNLLPDISDIRTDEGNSRVLMEMLYSIFGISTRNGVAENLFEFFIKVFTDSVSRLLACGLRSKYHLVSGNEKSFKGRIVFNEHIRQNFIHKERIFVEYETYSQNRPENRIIKTTLEALYRKTEDNNNAKDIKNLVSHMEEIPSSFDVDKDFGTIILDRNMIDYTIPLYWCRIFLKGLGLAGASRENVPYMLIVDTEALFNAYVGRMAASENENGTYQLRYTVDVRNEAVTKGVSVVKVNLDWTFYDRVHDRHISDAESLYMSTPGYRAIPGYGADRLRSMAGSYLSDALV